MNKHLLLILLGFGLIGCATQAPYPNLTTTSYERERYCQTTNQDSYWGVCYVNRTINDPNHEVVMNAERQYYSDATGMWSELIITSKMIEERYQNGLITTNEANFEFNRKLNDYRRARNSRAEQYRLEAENKRREQGLALQQLGQALQQSNQMISGNNGYGKMYTLQKEVEQDFNKVCIYGFGAETKTRVISIAGICPLSIKE